MDISIRFTAHKITDLFHKMISPEIDALYWKFDTFVESSPNWIDLSAPQSGLI